MPEPRRRPSRHFFDREPDGWVRLRLRLSPEEAAAIEQAAGTTPVLTWMYQVLDEAATREIEKVRASLSDIEPPRSAPDDHPRVDG